MGYIYLGEYYHNRKALKDAEPKGRKKKKKKRKGPVVGYYFDGKKTHTLYEDHWSTK